ncbi:MAG: 4'-phosphopantetheinyl transferase superfamily protein [Candidatus Omnitrophica bacterium]|nr:4'-phosphopantetheinyl transferase superfamily protein [Candidatus Omnitrophota bacterium]
MLDKKQYSLVEKVTLKRLGSSFTASLCFSCNKLDILKDSKETFLHSEELDYFKTLSFEKRHKSYLLGKFCAKKALLLPLDKKVPSSILIRSGVFGHPVVIYPDPENHQISISHSGDWSAAIAYPAVHPMAVDIETVDPGRLKTIEAMLTSSEKDMIKKLPVPEAAGYTILWTIKESLSKLLKTGRAAPFDIYEVKKLDYFENCFTSSFINFGQYKVTSFIFTNMACSIISPLESEFDLDIQALIEQLQELI